MSPAEPPPLAVSAVGVPAARRPDAVRFVGLAVDVALFNAAILAGYALMPAHIATFVAGILVNYFLRIRPTLLARGKGSSLPLHASLAVASLAALLVRGGLLALFLEWHWPAELAIVPAALGGAAVTVAVRDLLLMPVVQSRSELIRRLTVIVLAYAIAVRLLCIAQVNLLPEEAYYWNYWQHPAIGYLDHPPMVAWLIGLGTSLFGDTEMGVRLGAFVSQIIASFFAYRLTRNLFGGTSALVALILMQILPFFFITGVLMTPDAPLMAAWAGCLCFLERALVAGRGRAWWGVGLCLGAGLVSKYTIGLLVPATLIFMLLDPKARGWLLRWEPYAAAAVALAIFYPVILWNEEHHWASFAFQTARRLAAPVRFALPRLLDSILLLLTPTGFASLLIALGRPGAEEPDEASRRALRFVRVFVLVPLAVFVVFSLRHDVKLDWTGSLWLAALPALAAWIAREGGARRVRAIVHAAWMPTGVVTLLLFGWILHYLTLGWPGIGYSKHLELLPVGWRQLGEEVNELAAEIQRDQESVPLVVGMDPYRLASEVAFYSPDPGVSVAETTSSYLFGGTGLMYEQWLPVNKLRGRTLLLLAWDPRRLKSKGVQSRVSGWQPIKSLDLRRHGHLIRRLYYRVAYNYQPLPTVAGPGSLP